MSLQVGSRLGHYDVSALIGEGGMGQVYRATDTQLGRDDRARVQAYPAPAGLAGGALTNICGSDCL